PLAAMASLPGVRGPEVRRVPGDQYAVLEADRVTGLNDWLKTHGYASRPELEEGFTDYLQKKWKITAFKVDKEWADQHGGAHAAVRMSFKADQPYFPYAEPAHLRRGAERASGTRMMRVYVVADARMQGQFGDDKTRWPGKVVWANRLDAAPRKVLL